MFGIGIPELVIIIIVALLVVGPSKLPELARSMGKALGEFRRLADDVKETIEQEMAKEPEKEEETQKEAKIEEEKQETGAQEGREEPVKAEEATMFQGQLFAEEGPSQGQKEEQKEEQRAEGETAAGAPETAGQEAKGDLAEKIAEGIRVNEPQKT